MLTLNGNLNAFLQLSVMTFQFMLQHDSMKVSFLNLLTLYSSQQLSLQLLYFIFFDHPSISSSLSLSALALLTSCLSLCKRSFFISNGYRLSFSFSSSKRKALFSWARYSLQFMQAEKLSSSKPVNEFHCRVNFWKNF